MARQKGTANLAASLEVLAGAPLDARTKVALKADLTASGTFPYPYEGMKVYVAEEHKYYTLIGSDPTVSANWQEDGSGGGGTGGGHAIEDEGTALTQRDTLNFIDFDMEDDSTNEKTQVAMHELTSAEMEEIMSNPPGPSTPTDFDDLTNRPTKNVTSMDDIITPLPSIRPRQFKYSTDEQVVGEWINGKPVYQKTIDFGALPNNKIKSVLHGISNLKMCVDVHGVFTDGTTTMTIPFPSASGSTVTAGVSATEVSITTTSNRTAYSGYVYITYTKTTD